MALISIKPALSLLVYIPILLMVCFYLTSISALLLILVHSYYSWTQNSQGDHLTASFHQFMESSCHAVIASAIKQAINSCGKDTDCLCEEILQIIKNHPLGKLILEVQLNIKLHIVEHPLLTKIGSTSNTQVKAKIEPINPTQAEAGIGSTNTTQAEAEIESTNTTQVKVKKNDQENDMQNEAFYLKPQARQKLHYEFDSVSTTLYLYWILSFFHADPE